MSSPHETLNRSRKAAFVLASTDHGTMIINRFDYHKMETRDHTYGVGFSLLENGHFDLGDVLCLKDILSVQRQLRGAGVIALDIGANLGVHTIEWAKHMSGWGNVLAIEAQERIFYALSGNISINNCFNARAVNIAVGNQVAIMRIPVPDYCSPGSFGSLELQFRPQTEFIGQPINYADHAMVEVSVRTIDSFALPRLDLVKIDVEGMEMAVLEGAINTMKTQRPVMFIEHIKIERGLLYNFMRDMDYTLIDVGMNSVAFHREDPIHDYIQVIPKS